jgi:hypothetical protein
MNYIVGSDSRLRKKHQTEFIKSIRINRGSLTRRSLTFVRALISIIWVHNYVDVKASGLNSSNIQLYFNLFISATVGFSEDGRNMILGLQAVISAYLDKSPKMVIFT